MDRRTFLHTALLSATAVGIAPMAAFAAPTGRFEGRSRHTTSGGVTVEQGNGGTLIRLHDDFKLDSGPDPIVGLGKDGKWDPATYSGDLANLNGGQDYTVPSGVDAAAYNEVYIWCRAADVPLGVASLK